MRPRLRVRDLVDDEALGICLSVAAGETGLDRSIRGSRVQKSGLALAGHFHGIESSRVQVLGVTEMTYLHSLSTAASEAAVARFLERDLCCVVISEGERCMLPEAAATRALITGADASETPLLVSKERSSRTITALHSLLDERLAARARVHGVLVDVFEVGLLLLGSSGVGKSEVALELIMRGHRLVADDVVDCVYRPPGMVFGQPADLLRHHLEVRGLGILNIKDLFGVTAVRDRKRIDVIVQLADETAEGDYDRLGLEPRFHSVLDVEIPELLIQVRPGRDMASIMEIAARNELLKMAGHNSAHEFVGRLQGSMTPAESSGWSTDAAASHTPRPAMPAAKRGAVRAIRRPPESSVGLPWPRNK